jgi:hypothetical protein
MKGKHLLDIILSHSHSEPSPVIRGAGRRKMDEARMHHISHVKPAKTCMAKMDVQIIHPFIKLWIILLKAESI